MMRFAVGVRPKLTEKEAAWIVYFAFFALVTFMWWPALFEGKAIISGDSIIHGLPLLHFFRDFLHGGVSPLWAKEIYGGHALFAEGQGGFASPLNLLVAWVFPSVLGTSVFHYLCMLIGGSGVIKLCRLLGTTIWSAGFAAMAVTFGSCWLPEQNNLTISGAMIWLPWALVALEIWIRRPSALSATGMGLVCALLLLAGYPQVIHGFVIFALLSLLVMPFSKDGKQLWKQCSHRYVYTGILAVALCLGLSAIQLLPLVELVGLSHRGSGIGLVFQSPAIYYLRGLIFPLDSPDQFSSVSSLLVCMLASLTVVMRTPWRIKGYLIASMALLMLGMGEALFVFRWVYSAHLIPGLHYFRLLWVYIGIAVVGMAVLAAFAIDRVTCWLSSHGDSRKWSAPVSCMALFFVSGWLAVVIFSAPAGRLLPTILMAGIPLLIAVALSAVGRAALIPAMLFTVMLVQCLCFSINQLKFHDSKFLTSKAIVESSPNQKFQEGKFFTVSTGISYAFLDSKFPGIDKMAQRAVASNLGMTNLLHGDSSLDGALALELYNRDLLSQTLADEVHGIGKASLGSRAIDVLNVRYVTADQELHAPGLRVARHDPLGFWVMENTSVRPFVQTYAHAIQAVSADDALAKMRGMQSPTLVVQADPAGEALPSNDPTAINGLAALVTVSENRFNHYIIDVQSPFACWVFLADANYPGWHATVDGVKATVWTAQLLGKAVHVPAGKHQVTVGFRSESFRLGLKISVVSLLVTLALLIASGAKRWRNKVRPFVS
jgi:hypothetical protein